MSLIYVTGPTGAGKSTVRQGLAEMGYETYDVDDEGMRVSMQPTSDSGKQLLTVPNTKIEELKRKASHGIIYICGTVPTDADFAHMFDVIFLLSITENLQEERIRTRTNSSYGKNQKQLETALKWRKKQMDKYTGLGAVSIDAAQPLEIILEKIVTYVSDLDS